MALDLDAAGRAMRRVAEPLGLSAERGGLGHPQGRRRKHGGRRARPSRREGQGSPHAMPWSGSAAQARRMRPTSPACSACARSSFRRPPAPPPRSGFSRAPVLRAGALAARSSFSEELRRGRHQRTFCPNSKRRAATASSRPASRRTTVTVERIADMRLVGQMHDITVPLPAGPIDAAQPRRHPRRPSPKAYSARYTSVYEGARMEAINFRVRCAGPAPKLSLHGAAGGGDAAAKHQGHAQRLVRGAAHAEATVYDRYALVGRRSRSPDPRSSRSARRPRSFRRAIVVEVDDESATCASRIAAARRAEADRHVRTCRCSRPCARIESDPISLEIMWSRLVNVVEEMWLTVCRTAFSLVISEAQDFACELLDPDGETLAHSPRAMPVFNLTLPRAVKALLARYPAETLEARRRARHQRSVALRRPSLRHRRGDAGLQGRASRRPHGHRRPRLRHRRHQGLACAPARSSRKASRFRR